MNAPELVFLAVSSFSLVVHVGSLRRLFYKAFTKNHVESLAWRGQIRTVGCRIVAAVAYVVVALNALLGSIFAAQIALGVFCFTQVLWQANSLADVHLRRRIQNVVISPQRGDHV